MKFLYLYSTLGCHLCDHAKAVLNSVNQLQPLEFTEVDIADSEELFELYGVRIPVVVCKQTGKDIGWPFDHESFLRWLSCL